MTLQEYMTIEELVQKLSDEWGWKVTPETRISAAGLDSLEFLELMVQYSIPESLQPNIDTVGDLHRVAFVSFSS